MATDPAPHHSWNRNTYQTTVAARRIPEINTKLFLLTQTTNVTILMMDGGTNAQFTVEYALGDGRSTDELEQDIREAFSCDTVPTQG